MKFYSGTTRGFYDPEISPVIPPDAVEVSDSDYLALFEGQSAGKEIAPNAQGYPVLIDPVLTDAQVATSVRLERNMRLTESDWTQFVDVTGIDKAAWATYRQALRDVTKQPGFPRNVVWPEKP